MQNYLTVTTSDHKRDAKGSIRSVFPGERVYDLDDSPQAKSESFLVVKQSDKTKILKEHRREIGFEYDSDITSDLQLCQKILASGSYTPTSENMIDFSDDLSRIIATSQTSDSRNAGSVVGMAVFGAIGFVALSFTIVGAFVGGLLGVGMGRYAGRKLTKKMKRKKKCTNEELFRLKLQCLVKMGKIQRTEMQHNLNKYRIQLEKILQEFTFVFDLSLFEKPKKIATILTKLHNFLLNVSNQKAMLLSYKLFKNYLKLVQNDKAEIEKEIANKVYSVFMPFKNAIEFTSKKDKKLEKLTSYAKIKAFVQQPWVREILKRNPDPYADAEFLKNFKAKLKEPVDLEEKIGQALKWDRKTVKDVINRIDEKDLVNNENRANPAKSSPTRKFNEKASPSKLKQSSGKWQELLIDRKRSKTLEDDIDEGVTATVLQKVNLVKASSQKFRVGSVSPGQSLNALPDQGTFRSACNLKHPKDHHLPQLSASNSAEKKLLSRPDANHGKNKYKLIVDIDSSEDSSADDGNNEEEQKEVMDDSYLFQKSQTQKSPREFDFQIANGIHIPLTGSIIKNANEIQLPGEGTPQRGRRSVEMMKKRPQSEARNGPSMEQPKIQLLKMNSDPDIEDPVLEPVSLDEVDEPVDKSVDRQLDKSADNLFNKSEEKKDLEASRYQNSKHDLGVKQIESNKSETNKKPDTKQEIIYQKLISISMDTHSKWDVIKNDKELKVFKIKPENSDVVLIKAWAFIPDTTPLQIFNCIYDTKIRGKWDTVLHDPHVVEKIDEFIDIFYFCVKAPFAVSNRDFVQKRSYQFDYPEKGDIIISFQSTSHPKAPPIKGNVRGDTHIAGYIMKPSKLGKGSELHLITQVDVKGSIPKMVVNFVAGRAPAEWILKLKKACHTYNR